MAKVDELDGLVCETCDCHEVQWGRPVRIPVECDARTLGKIGESVAAGFLVSRGYEVLEFNHRTPYGEADLVCRENGELVLVEVKTRRGSECFPEEAVGRDKLRRYGNIMLDFLRRGDAPEKVRFDVVALNLCLKAPCHLFHYVGVCSWVG